MILFPVEKHVDFAVTPKSCNRQRFKYFSLPILLNNTHSILHSVVIIYHERYTCANTKHTHRTLNRDTLTTTTLAVFETTFLSCNLIKSFFPYPFENLFTDRTTTVSLVRIQNE